MKIHGAAAWETLHFVKGHSSPPQDLLLPSMIMAVVPIMLSSMLSSIPRTRQLSFSRLDNYNRDPHDEDGGPLSTRKRNSIPPPF